jgi:4-amino-4-deoxy-L-arabinose transferase-like glycosyltransferase
MARIGNVWRLLALVLILAVSLFRIVYVGWLSPFELAQDEAHYWDWARNLDWSYYSKGPLVAWLMHISLWLFKSLSVSLTGSEILAIRLPAIACGALFLLAVYWLTVLIHRRESLAFYVTAIAAVLPTTTAGGILMTIDSPFVCLWTWSLLVGYYALFRQKLWAWPILGAMIGLGILAKYTMLLWPASAVLFCLFTPAYRKTFKEPGIWICALVTGLCCLPILIWNISNDWVSLRHVAGQAGVSQQRSTIRWLGPLEYIGSQFALGMVIFTAIWLGGMLKYRPGREVRPERLYFWWLSAPTIALFFLVSFRVGIQANWPIVGFVSGTILASRRYAGRCRCNTWRNLLIVTVVLSLVVTGFALNPKPLIPVMSGVLGKDKVRNWDPTSRLRGWKWLAEKVDHYRAEIRESEQKEPVLVADRWNYAGEIGFFAQGQPKVLCVGRATGDRYSQYDLWRPNPIDDAQEFLGQTFILVGEPKEEYPSAFEQLDPPIKLEYREHGELVATWFISIGRGYKGFPAKTKSGRY